MGVKVENIKEFLKNQKVMTISVIKNSNPWSAPVYYLYDKSFYFFSSPGSIHILYGVDKIVSCSIFFDGNEIKDLKGVQMRGRLYKPDSKEALTPFLKYVKKFNSFLPQKSIDILDLKRVFKSELYAFLPEYIVYKDNLTGFGNKNIIDVSSL